MNEDTTPQTETTDADEFVTKSLDAIVQVLVGSNEQRRQTALSLLRDGDPRVVLQLVDRLVAKLRSKEADVASRAHIALVAAGPIAVPALCQGVLASKSTPYELRFVGALFSLGEGMTPQDRVHVTIALISMMMATKDPSLRLHLQTGLLAWRKADDAARLAAQAVSTK